MDAPSSGPQSAEKIYNIGVITNATFIYPNGADIPFNEYLIKVLMAAIKPYNKNVAIFFDKKVKEENKDNWYNIKEYSDDAKIRLISSFAGTLGSKIQNLIAIGVDPTFDKRSYVDTSLSTAKNAVQIICFTLISDLWNQKREKNHPLSEEQKKCLKDFFEQSIELRIRDYYALLKNLYNIYKKNNLPFPIPELSSMENQLQPGSPLTEAFDQLHTISDSSNVDKYSLKTCGEVEKQVTHLLGIFGFLTSYKMVSIKGIDYEQVRSGTERYLHNYIALGSGNGNTNVARLKYMDKPIDTDSVLLYKDDYLKGVNLSPFIIDFNALTFQSNAKICFFSTIDDIDTETDPDADPDVKKCIHFRFLENDSIEHIPLSTATEQPVNQLLQSADARKEIKLQTVSRQFMDAKRTILGDLVININDNQ